MDVSQALATMDRKARLSAAWIFLLLNVIFRDLHELFRPGMLAEMASGTVNGVRMTELTLLFGGMLGEVLIAMVIMSRILSRRVNRWANVVVAVVAVLLMLSSPPADLDDMFFLGVGVVTLALIVWYAWTWPAVRDETSADLPHRETVSS